MLAEIVRRPAFSEAEYRERLARARRVLAQQDLHACVCFAPEHIYYFAGYEAHTQFSIQAVVFGPNDTEPTLILRDVDRVNAEESSWVKDIRTYHHMHQDPAKVIAEALDARASARGKVGVCLNAYSLPGAFAVRLLETIGTSRVTDVTAVIERVRYVKSAQEITYIREAATYANRGLQRVRDVLAAGLTEIQLAGEIEAAMRQAGSDYSAMPTWLSSGPRTRGSHKTPTDRAIARGDVIKMEFAGVSHRYHAVTMQTLWLGEPSAKARSAYEGALAALRSGASAVGIGVPVAKAEDAAFSALRLASFNVATHARFGYGVSAAYPPSWLEGLDITCDSQDVFEANMAFVLHTTVYTPDGLGLLIGGAYVLTGQGLELLSGGDLNLMVV